MKRIIKYFKYILSYRELIHNLTVKEFKIRYKTAVLGFLWALLNPIIMMLIFAAVFSFFIKLGIENYPIFLLIALLPWYFFSQSLSVATTSMGDNANLIKKVSFPRESIPLSIVLSNLINFLLSLIILFAFMLIFKVKITILAFLLPAVILIQVILVLGVSLIASTLHIFYRDTKYIVELLLLCGFYLTPIFYPLSFVPQKFQKIYLLNPMAGIVTMYRDLLLNGSLPNTAVFVSSIFFSLLLFVIGLVMFRNKEKVFADYV